MVINSLPIGEPLDTLCQIEVKEGADGDRVTAGRAIIAPGKSVRAKLCADARKGAVVWTWLFPWPSPVLFSVPDIRW